MSIESLKELLDYLPLNTSDACNYENLACVWLTGDLVIEITGVRIHDAEDWFNERIMYALEEERLIRKMKEKALKNLITK